nr:MAG TPA: hypothetical protein [Caudoviricetes sp.]DAY28358.1 MAG TPA: hypothetical protein [Caudoviricetes sp.]
MVFPPKSSIAVGGSRFFLPLKRERKKSRLIL